MFGAERLAVARRVSTNHLRVSLNAASHHIPKRIYIWSGNGCTFKFLSCYFSSPGLSSRKIAQSQGYDSGERIGQRKLHVSKPTHRASKTLWQWNCLFLEPKKKRTSKNLCFTEQEHTKFKRQGHLTAHESSIWVQRRLIRVHFSRVPSRIYSVLLESQHWVISEGKKIKPPVLFMSYSLLAFKVKERCHSSNTSERNAQPELELMTVAFWILLCENGVPSYNRTAKPFLADKQKLHWKVRYSRRRYKLPAKSKLAIHNKRSFNEARIAYFLMLAWIF